MRTMHLFAGAGGGLLADLILGHTPVCTVEWDAYACAVLRERRAEGWFPGLHVFEGDIRMFDPSEWKGRVDCIHAGFPCQDISAAGKGAGIKGERSGLFSEVLRAIDAIRPPLVFLENSPLIVTRGLDHVLRSLTERGYDARWMVLAASDVGAPHLRKRWWCLAWRSDCDRRGLQVVRRSGEVDRERIESACRNESDRFCVTAHTNSDKHEGGPPAGQGQRQDSRTASVCSDSQGNGRSERRPEQLREQGRSCASGVCCEIPDADEVGRSGRGGMLGEIGRGESQDGGSDTNGAGLAEREGESSHDGEEQSTPLGADWWTTEPDVGRVAYGVAARVDQIKCLGNGQVPLCAAVAWKILGGE